MPDIDLVGGIRVLVVEDDASLADLLRRALVDDGIEPVIVGSAARALETASSARFDFIILDWMLPDGDGPTVCATLRSRGNKTPILMLTARGQLQDRIVGLRSGADDYMVKPFELDELLARLDAHVRRAGYTLERA